jgi:hypothetical protein
MNSTRAVDPRPQQESVPKMKMTTTIPAEITTPDSVETSLGTLRFFDGLPDKATVEKVFDNLDFMRGVDVFLNTTAATSTLANIEGLKSVGCNNQTVVIHENRVDAKTSADTEHPDGDPLELHRPEGWASRRRDTSRCAGFG